MIYLFCIVLGWALAATWYAWKCERAWDRAYRYAVKRAERPGFGGRAYSDMATVLVLARDEDVNA